MNNKRILMMAALSLVLMACHTGQKNNPYMSHDEDSATIHKMAILGVCVKDPTRTMSIIPAVLMG